jgi:hypothetical protein
MYQPGKDFADWAKAKDLLGKLIYFYAANGTIDNAKGYKQVPSYFVEVYGKKPPMANVFLALAVKDPDLKGVNDDEVKESLEDIQKKTKSGGAHLMKGCAWNSIRSLTTQRNGIPQQQTAT